MARTDRFTLIFAAMLLSSAAVAGPATEAPKAAADAQPAIAARASAADGFTVVEDGTYQPPAPPKIVRRWRVPADTSLRQVFDTWARAEGWRVYWPNADKATDWQTVIEVNFEADNFEDAVTRVIEGLPHELGLVATFNRANSPRLLTVCESACKQEIR